MGVVRIDNVRKSFGAVEALKGVSFGIDEGEFVALVGPSGCGKSTLLRLIAGLEDITAGEISIGGEMVNELTPRERNIAMVFQNYALYPHMTVAENIGFSLRLKRAPPEAIKTSVAKAADILGLGALLDRYPGQLSGGERQRVAMGRTIVRDSKVFLFDEPLSNLDAQLRVQMRLEIKQLHQTLGNTMIYVTHDQIEAMTMADRIVLMRDGDIEQIGAPLELYDRPTNAFVAGFIGSPTMNLIKGRIAHGEAGPVFATESGTRLPLPGNTTAVLEGRAVIYGVRPEHIAVALAQGSGGLEAEIQLVEPTGSDTLLVLGIGATTLQCVIHTRLDKQPGETVQIKPDTSKLHLFEADSGKRIAVG